MKKLIALLTLSLSSGYTQAQITGTFKKFDPKKHDNISISVHYYSTLEREYIELKSKPDSLGNFAIELPYKNETDLCFLSIDKYLATTLVVKNGIHVTLDARSKKKIQFLSSGKKGIFTGPDAAATNYFNNASNVAFKGYNSKASQIGFHSKDSAHIRSAQLAVAFAKHQEDLDQYIMKHPSQYAAIVNNEELAHYYYHQMIINWGLPLEEVQQKKMLSYKAQHSSMWTNDFYSLLYNKLYYGNNSEYNETTKSTILNSLHPDERHSFSKFFTEMIKRENKEPYDKTRYAEGKEKYIDQYSTEVYAAHLANYIKKIKALDIADPDRLLVASIPETADRPTYFAETRALLDSKKSIKLYDDIAAQDEEITNRLINMLADAPEASALGQLEAANTSVSMYHAEHDSLDMLLNAIKNEYPNKIIILDIWGTWCGPCREDIMASKEKLQELKANDIEVVYLCEGRSSKKSTWMESVLKMKMTGTQIFMSATLSAQFLEQFNVTGYPSHIFIDNSGEYHTDEEHFLQKLDVEEVVKEYGN
jgi:thiol-disulfide isomerase/thioredoxin